MNILLAPSWVWEDEKICEITFNRTCIYVFRTHTHTRARCWRPRRRDAFIMCPKNRKNGNFHVCMVKWVGKGVRLEDFRNLRCWKLFTFGGRINLKHTKVANSREGGVEGLDERANNRIVLLDALWKVDWFCISNFDSANIWSVKLYKIWNQLNQHIKKLKILSLSLFRHKWPSGEESLMDG